MELLEIEKELAGPLAKEKMAEYDAQLLALQNRLKSEMDAGMMPVEYQQCQQLEEAVVTARKLLRLQIQ